MVTHGAHTPWLLEVLMLMVGRARSTCATVRPVARGAQWGFRCALRGPWVTGTMHHQPTAATHCGPRHMCTLRDLVNHGTLWGFVIHGACHHVSRAAEAQGAGSHNAACKQPCGTL